MMHYKKGENIEQELRKVDVPFKDCLPKEQNDFLWMQVKGGTKVNNVLDYAKNALDKGEYRSVVWSGFGGGVVKTVSCAEILKRSYPFYQLTRMCYTSAEEQWLPQMEGLEEIVVNRQMPCIHILLSLDPLEQSINGVQKPNTRTDFWIREEKSSNTNKRHPNNNNQNNNQNSNNRKRNNKKSMGSQSAQQQTQPHQQNQNKGPTNKKHHQVQAQKETEAASMNS